MRMQAFLGWTVIVVVFYSVSMALLWPVFWFIRRLRPNVRGLRWVYAAASVGCGFALWYSIPWGVYQIFGRASH
jgi:hypothetical protein